MIILNDSKKREENLKTLNLKKNATNEDIKLAYRRMAKKTHPDLNKDDPKAPKKFLKVKNAYNDLKKPNTQKIRIQNRDYEEPWNLRGFDALFRNFLNNDFFFDFEKNKSNEVPISPPEPYVDLNELIKRKRRFKRFF